jgi:hypothetical protein
VTDINHTQEQLLSAIETLAAKAADQGSSGYAFRYAAAANQLAEARAWLNSSAQPHGGVSVSD